MVQEFIAEGRIVWGHPIIGEKACNYVNGKKGAPKLNKHNQEYDEYKFGIAIPVDKFNAEIYPYLHAEASAHYPAGVPADFAWKFKDSATSVDGNGKSFNEYEGRAGCIVLAIKSSSFAPDVVKHDGNVYNKLQANEIKCGDFVAVKCSAEYNGVNGLYINPEMVAHIGYGDEIRSGGANPEEAFAGYNFTLPQGASAQPTLGSAPLPAPAAQPMAQPAPAAQPAAGLPPPATGFVANVGQQPAPAAPAPMAGLPQGR